MRRKIHKIMAILLSIPLMWQVITGYILYYRYDKAGKPRPWKEVLVKLHNGEWMGGWIFIIGLFYCFILLVFIIEGLLLLEDEKEKNAGG